MIGLALLQLAAAAAAPSFDCAKAHSAVEHAICADAALAELDREEARIYRLARAAPEANRDALRDRQRRFLAERDSCPESIVPLAECLRTAYLGDIAELRRLAGLADDRDGLSLGPARYVCDGGYHDVYVTVFATAPEQGWLAIPAADEGQPLVADPAAPQVLVGRYATDMRYAVDKAEVRVGARICTLAE
ncbi:MAG TPA: lysozyme inhibitor LprI family protein [Croceibacterium sp.]